jgi:uncharacterized protein involved in cysteine biosynthesis
MRGMCFCPSFRDASYANERRARFGTVHLLMQLVPVLNMFFLMTTAVGSGLYSVKEEERRHQQEGRHLLPDEPYVDNPI